jgi:transcriptional regulator with XRE-family HTH domain
MNGFREDALRNFPKSREYREAFAEEFLNAWIATQIKTLREERQWTQERLATEAGMRQPRISALESIDYSSWSVNILRRLARAFDVDLAVEFRSYGERLLDYDRFEGRLLQEPAFPDDKLFQSAIRGGREDDSTSLTLTPAGSRTNVAFLADYRMKRTGTSAILLDSVSTGQETFPTSEPAITATRWMRGGER